MDAAPDTTGKVTSRFVSETDLTAAKEKRAEEWKKAYERLGEEAPQMPDDDESYDPRSLYERLKEQKDRKQEAFEEQLKFKNQFRALDEEEIGFLDSVSDDRREEDKKRQREIDDEVLAFRQAVAKRQVSPPNPMLPTSTSPDPTSTSKPPAGPSISASATPPVPLAKSASPPNVASSSSGPTTKPLPSNLRKKHNPKAILMGGLVKRKTSTGEEDVKRKNAGASSTGKTSQNGEAGQPPEGSARNSANRDKEGKDDVNDVKRRRVDRTEGALG